MDNGDINQHIILFIVLYIYIDLLCFYSLPSYQNDNKLDNNNNNNQPSRADIPELRDILKTKKMVTEDFQS